MKHRPLLILLLIFLTGSVHATEPAALANDCDGCHGPLGASVDSDIPVIGGQSAASIEKALLQFQNWDRPCSTSEYRHGDTSRKAVNMCQISEPLSSEDISALAIHYSNQPFTGRYISDR